MIIYTGQTLLRTLSSNPVKRNLYIFLSYSDIFKKLPLLYFFSYCQLPNFNQTVNNFPGLSTSTAMNPRSSAGRPNLYHHQYYYETTRPPETSTDTRPGTRTTQTRPQEAARSYENNVLCIVTVHGSWTPHDESGGRESSTNPCGRTSSAVCGAVREVRGASQVEERGRIWSEDE